MKQTFLSLSLLLLLITLACAPSAVLETPTSFSSLSPTITFTPTLLLASKISSSPTPSLTPSPTSTPLPTVTPTFVPAINPSNVSQLTAILTAEDRYGSPHAMFSVDGRRLIAKTSPIASGPDQEPVSKLFFWDVETLQELPSLQTNDRIFFTNLVLHPDGERVLIGTWIATPAISLLNLSDGTHLIDIEVPRKTTGYLVERITLSPDGQWIAVGFADGRLEIYATRDGKRVFETKIQQIGRVHALAFSPDSSLLAVGGRDKRIYLWEVSNWSLLATFPPGKAPVFDLAFSPDGVFLAAAEGGTTGQVSIWKIETPSTQSLSASFPFSSFSVEFSPDGSLIVAGGENGHLKFWRMDTYEMVASFPAHKTRIEALDFSPDGRFLASASISTYRRYDKQGDKASVKLWGLPQK